MSLALLMNIFSKVETLIACIGTVILLLQYDLSLLEQQKYAISCGVCRIGLNHLVLAINTHYLRLSFKIYFITRRLSLISKSVVK